MTTCVGTIHLSSGNVVFLYCGFCGFGNSNMDDFLKHTFQSHIKPHDEHDFVASCEEAPSNNNAEKWEEEAGEEELVDFKVEVLHTKHGYSMDSLDTRVKTKIMKKNGILEELNFDESLDEDQMADDCLATQEDAKTNKYANSTQQYQAESTGAILATGIKLRTGTKRKRTSPTTDASSFSCETCGKCFPKAEYLRRHIRRHGVGLHVCEFCGARFVDSSNYRVHCYRHLGIKPYPCTVCNKRFTNSTELTLHNRTHNGERPFVCEECGQCFRTRSFLNYHGLRHRNERPHVCATCGKSFYERQLLTDHEVSHSTERPFACETCGMKFSRHKTLKVHEKLHRPPKYLCTQCPKAYAQSAGLIAHVNSFHKAKQKKNRETADQTT